MFTVSWAAWAAIFFLSCSVIRNIERRQDDTEVKINLLKAQLEKVQEDLKEISSFRESITNIRVTLSSIEEKVKRNEGRLEISQKNSDDIAKIKDSIVQLSEQIKMLEDVINTKKKAQEKSIIMPNKVINDAEIDMKEGRLDEAIAKLRSIAEMKKDEMKYRILLGDLYFRKGEYNRAIAEWSFVIDNKSDSGDSYVPKAYIRISQAYVRLGEKEKAKVFLNLLIKKFPDSPESKTAYELLKGM